MADREALKAAAVQVAGRWGLDVAEIELLSMTENAVFGINTVDGDRAVLRMHRPGYNTRAQMESELVWLESLRTAGLDAPAPRHTVDGEAYVAVAVGGAVRQVGVIDWVDGVALEAVLQKDRSLVEDHYRRLGSIMARIRAHAERWDPPPGFDRRRWDAEGLVGDDPLWGRFWAVSALTHGQRDVFSRARRVLHDRLAALPLDRSVFGLIHADLHLTNILASDDRLVVIDFDDAGFGWYPYEMAVALQPVVDEPWFDDARRALIDGYRNVHPVSDDELNWLPMFITVRSLILVGWLDARPELGLGEQLPELIADAERDVEQFLSS